MKEVRFYEETEDELLDFAVIIAEAEGKLVFCKHRERNTYEIPGGHREEGEAIEEAARRELYEETGAVEYTLLPVCVYSVTDPCRFGGRESFGMLYHAEIFKFEPMLEHEIEKIILVDELEGEWTYPEIQPKLIKEAARRGYIKR